MRRIAFLAVVVTSLVFASQATASTTTAITMKLNEPVLPSFKTCPIFPAGFCGSGLVKPFGQATETILFGGGCGGACDLRTINVAGGSFTSDEVNLGPASPCASPRSNCPSALDDTIIGGTGSFTGATGSFSGTVGGKGFANSLMFSGSITVP